MKKFIFFPAILAVLFIVTNCVNVVDGGNDITRKFWAQNNVTKTFYQVNAEKLAENSRCEVWVEKGSGVNEATANSVANSYNTVYARMMNTFGYTIKDPQLGTVNTMEIAHWLPTGKTSGAKLTILLLDIKDGWKTNADPYVGGYFYPIDLLENDPTHDVLKYSNELDMIYLDTYPSVLGSSDSNETLAHEMQHLMNFVSSIVFRTSGNSISLMNTWIDEGLSAAAQWVYSGTISKMRLDHYNNDPSGLIKKGNNFFIWDNHDDNPLANLDDYATVYLFFQYLRLQASKPSDIYFDIISSKYPDYNAVTTAKNINNIHKNNWALLLRDWHAANFIKAASGLYGYNNYSTLNNVVAPMAPAAPTSLSLYPGEGVYSKITTTASLPTASGNIKYAGLNSNGVVSDTTGSADGARLTYNVNTDQEGLTETGNTTGTPSVGISTPGSGSLQTGSSKFSGPFMVDMGYFNRKNGNGGVSDIEIKRALNSSSGSRSVNKSGGTVKFDLSTLERVYIDE